MKKLAFILFGLTFFSTSSALAQPDQYECTLNAYSQKTESLAFSYNIKIQAGTTSLKPIGPQYFHNYSVIETADIGIYPYFLITKVGLVVGHEVAALPRFLNKEHLNTKKSTARFSLVRRVETYQTSAYFDRPDRASVHNEVMNDLEEHAAPANLTEIASISIQGQGHTEVATGEYRLSLDCLRIKN